MCGVACRVYPIGRLDRNSEGLLLLTNDGEFANAVMHPSKHVAKVYRVTIRPDISDEQIAAMSDGMMIDGRMTAPAQVTVLEKRDDRAVIEMLPQGKWRELTPQEVSHILSAAGAKANKKEKRR